MVVRKNVPEHLHWLYMYKTDCTELEIIDSTTTGSVRSLRDICLRRLVDNLPSLGDHDLDNLSWPLQNQLWRSLKASSMVSIRAAQLLAHLDHAGFEIFQLGLTEVFPLGQMRKIDHDRMEQLDHAYTDTSQSQADLVDAARIARKTATAHMIAESLDSVVRRMRSQELLWTTSLKIPFQPSILRNIAAFGNMENLVHMVLQHQMSDHELNHMLMRHIAELSIKHGAFKQLRLLVLIPEKYHQAPVHNLGRVLIWARSLPQLQAVCLFTEVQHHDAPRIGKQVLFHEYWTRVDLLDGRKPSPALICKVAAQRYGLPPGAKRNNIYFEISDDTIGKFRPRLPRICECYERILQTLPGAETKTLPHLSINPQSNAISQKRDLRTSKKRTLGAFMDSMEGG